MAIGRSVVRVRVMQRHIAGFAIALVLILGAAACDDGKTSETSDSEDADKGAASAKKKEKPKLSKEEVAAINRKVWDQGQQYLKKMAAVHAALPKHGGGVKKCDDARIEARIKKSLTGAQPIVVDEPMLTFLATGKRPKEDPLAWAWIRQPIWLKDVARLRAEGETFDADRPRGGLQKAMKYLPMKPYMAVVRFNKRILPSEKNGKTIAGGFIADLMIMDIDQAELLCKTPYDVDQGGKYMHFTPDAAKGIKTALEAAKIQLTRLAETELSERLKTISTKLIAPPQFSALGDRRIPSADGSPTPSASGSSAP